MEDLGLEGTPGVSAGAPARATRAARRLRWRPRRRPGLATTYKILIFLKRRPGLSVEEFRRYYEEVHAPLCLSHSRGLSRYLRRYLDPPPGAAELPYDVVIELWFEDERAFRSTLAGLADGAMPAAIVEDEKRLFDRARTRVASVVERESELPERPRG